MLIRDGMKLGKEAVSALHMKDYWPQMNDRLLRTTNYRMVGFLKNEPVYRDFNRRPREWMNTLIALGCIAQTITDGVKILPPEV